MIEELVGKVKALVSPHCELARDGVAVPLRYRMNLLGRGHQGPATWFHRAGPPRPRKRVRPTAPREVLRFGDVAVARGLITREHLQEALLRQRVTGARLGETLVAMRIINDQDVARILAERHGVPLITLDDFIIDPAIAKLVPEHIAQRYRMIPVNKVGNRLSVAMVDPLNVQALDDVTLMTGLQTAVLVASSAGVTRAMNEVYGAQSQLDRVFGDIEGDLAREVRPVDHGDDFGELGENDAPIIRLVNLIITQAVMTGASEILLETFQREFRVRYRRDGRLWTEMTPPLGAAASILQRIRILAQLSVDGTDRARNGSIALRLNNRPVDLSVHVQTNRYGETFSLRIHDPRAVPEDFDALGLERGARLAFTEALAARDGLVVIAGPQRSGRATTLFAVARHVNLIARQVGWVGRTRAATHGLHDVVCDPRDLRGFAATLTALSEARPEVVLLEDIPDRATARALCDLLDAGVQVVARLAARDAEAALARVIRLGGTALAGHLRAISAQRLARRLCVQCRVPWTPPRELWRRHGAEPEVAAEAQVFGAGQCDACGREGFRGQVGMFEVMPVSSANRRALARGRSPARARAVALEEGARGFAAEALAKVAAGLTTFDEIAALDRALPPRTAPQAVPVDPFAALLPVTPVPGRMALAAVRRGETQRWVLGAGETIVGQFDDLANVRPEVDLAAYDTAGMIAPMHLRITRDGGRYFVEALIGSTGTQLNGRVLPLMQRRPLEPGDVLLLASSVVLVAELETPTG